MCCGLLHQRHRPAVLHQVPGGILLRQAVCRVPEPAVPSRALLPGALGAANTLSGGELQPVGWQWAAEQLFELPTGSLLRDRHQQTGFAGFLRP